MASPRTAAKWAERYRIEGPAGMIDRSSRPRRSPTKTPPQTVRRIVRLRWRKQLGPVQIAGQLGLPASTLHAVLSRCRINRLSHIDRVTNEPIRRYEHDHPGSLIHVDVTKFGNIPDGDHSRVAYAEICADEKADTAIAVLHRAVTCFADRGVTIERVLSDNGSAYVSNAWREACADLSLTHRRTRPYRPQTNGKIERFHRTLSDGWAYSRYYDSETARRAALQPSQHFYNHHRAHSAIGPLPPISRLTNLPGHHS